MKFFKLIHVISRRDLENPDISTLIPIPDNMKLGKAYERGSR
jgi:hypothetical protein